MKKYLLHHFAVTMKQFERQHQITNNQQFGKTTLTRKCTIKAPIHVRARVAISTLNILPEIGPHNGAIGTVVEIVSSSVGGRPLVCSYVHP
jgi:hypothetical protein